MARKWDHGQSKYRRSSRKFTPNLVTVPYSDWCYFLRYIHWLQDVHDQQAIVRQYCRYSGEIRISENIKQVTLRALQFSTSDPKGPCYLVAGREVLEQV